MELQTTSKHYLISIYPPPPPPSDFHLPPPPPPRSDLHFPPPRLISIYTPPSDFHLPPPPQPPPPSDLHPPPPRLISIYPPAGSSYLKQGSTLISDKSRPLHQILDPPRETEAFVSWISFCIDKYLKMYE